MIISIEQKEHSKFFNICAYKKLHNKLKINGEILKTDRLFRDS